MSQSELTPREKDRLEEHLARWSTAVKRESRSALSPVPKDDEVISVEQRMYSFSQGNDPEYKRYLETTGLGPCVGLVAYDERTKVGMVAHIDNDRALKPEGDDMWSPFLVNVRYQFDRFGSRGPYKIWVSGGYRGLSDKTYLSLFDTLPLLGEIVMEELDIVPGVNQWLDSKNIIFDLQTGVLYNVSPVKRARSKELDLLERYIVGDLFYSMAQQVDPKGLLRK